MRFEPHYSMTKMDIARNANIGFPGQAFVAQIGATDTAAEKDAGFRFVRVNLGSSQVRDFLRNQRPGPNAQGPQRPVHVKFDPTGSVLYLVDFGVIEANKGGLIPKCNSGGLWRVVRG